MTQAPRPGDEPDDDPATRKARATSSWIRYSHLGLQFGVTITLGVLAGTWADGQLAIAPWGTVVGSLLGIGAGIYLVVRETGFL